MVKCLGHIAGDEKLWTLREKVNDNFVIHRNNVYILITELLYFTAVYSENKSGGLGSLKNIFFKPAVR